MLYFDTSFLTPLILQEPTSADIERFMSGLPVGELAVSHWTRVEFASLLAREVRMGGLAPDDAQSANAQFETTITESFAILLPNIRDFDLARNYLGRHETGLRAGDALHLAVAGNRGVEAVFSLDRTMIRAGGILGLPVRTGIPT